MSVLCSLVQTMFIWSFPVWNCNFLKMLWHKTCKTLLHHHCLLTHRTNYPHSTAFKCCTSIQVLGWPWFWKLVLYIRPAVQAVLRTSCHRWVRCASGHHCHNIWQLYTGHEGGGNLPPNLLLAPRWLIYAIIWVNNQHCWHSRCTRLRVPGSVSLTANLIYILYRHRLAGCR